MPTPKNESVVKAFRLLTLIARQSGGMALGEVAQETGMTVPTAHRFLKTLVSVGALDRSDEKRYVLGTALIGAAPKPPKPPDLLGMLSRHSESLCHVLRETVHVATFADDMVKYIVKAEAPRSLRISTVVGTTLEAYCTGVGKALLAFMPATEVRRYMAGGSFYALTHRTITTHEAFVTELAKIRECGYSIDDEEFELGLRCIAAPIIVREHLVAAISCSGPSSRIEPSVFQTIATEVKRTAATIGRELSSYGLDELQIRASLS